MRLLVTTPMAVIADVSDVRHLRAEDETGAFGILPGHADFLTVLRVSVLTWRDGAGAEHHLAIRGGVLNVTGGDRVEIVTREAVGEDTFRRLGRAVLERFRAEARAEEESRAFATRLQMAAIRQMRRYLEAGRQPVPRGLPGTRDGPATPGLFDEGGTA